MSSAGISATAKPPLLFLALILVCGRADAADAPPDRGDGYLSEVRPLVQAYCSTCHSAEKHKGGLNLDRFESISQIRKDVEPWEHVAEMLEAGEMPPEGKKQPHRGRAPASPGMDACFPE